MTKVIIKTPEQIEKMRISGRILAQTLKHLKDVTEIGMTPIEISKIANQMIRDNGSEPTFLGYHGFPDVICISVNDQVQHCIPNNRPFEDGDIINYDLGVTYQGMITDSGISFGIGQISNNDQRLLEGTLSALNSAISAVKAGIYVGEISKIIENTLIKNQLSAVMELVGHGVGVNLHEEPDIPNIYYNKGYKLEKNMTIAIEPIANLGKAPIKFDKDGWSIYTKDGSKSAQFEHTLLVLEDGCEILTA